MTRYTLTGIKHVKYNNRTMIIIYLLTITFKMSYYSVYSHDMMTRIYESTCVMMMMMMVMVVLCVCIKKMQPLETEFLNVDAIDMHFDRQDEYIDRNTRKNG